MGNQKQRGYELRDGNSKEQVVTNSTNSYEIQKRVFFFPFCVFYAYKYQIFFYQRQKAAASLINQLWQI